MTPVRFGLFAIYVLSLTGGGYAGLRWLTPEGVTPGLKVEGAPVASEAEARAVAHAAGERLERHKVKLVLAGAEDKVIADKSLAELGASVDEEATVARARAFGKRGDLFERAEARLAARRGEVDVPVVWKTDGAGTTAMLEKLKETEDTSPVSARLDLDKRAVVPERDGRYIDVFGALAAIEDATRAVASGRGKAPDVIVLPVGSFPPRMTTEFVKALDISTVIGEYETYFSRGGDQQRRGKNIDNASQKLDGLVLSPGELVSFNEVVGERSEANGFQKSWEIFKGEMVEGVGGGTCQVASTFHAAIFFAGLEVLERLPHSRPSAYIPMGLDSTVVFPSVDLKVRNPHPFPVVVHARTEGNKLKVEVLGKTKPVTVAFGRDVVATVPYPRKVIEEPWLSGKKVIVKQHGIRGYRIKRSRVLTYADGTKKVESTSDFYPPTTEIYQVPPGFDESLLPTLPKEDEEPNAPAASGGKPTGGAVACAGEGCDKPADGVQFVDGPGAHAPTNQQAAPSKSFSIRR